MTEYNWKDNLDFRFYDFYQPEDVNLIYIDEENPSSIALKFEIRNQSGVEITLDGYNQESQKPKDINVKTPQEASTSKSPDNTTQENIASAENFHIEIRFRPGTLSTASLVQIDLSETSKEDWVMSRPFFHPNKEVSLYFLKCGRSLNLTNLGTTTLTLRGFAANSAGGSRGTNVTVNYNKFHLKLSDDSENTVPISGNKILNLTILGHRGQRKAPLAVCFANQNTILNNGQAENNIEIQITNLGNEAIALSPKTEFIIEIDAQAEGKEEPWAVAKKDEAANYNISIKKQDFQESKEQEQYWFWYADSSTVDKNIEEPRFTFRNIYRQIGSKQAVKASVIELKKELELPKKLEADIIQFKSDSEQTQVAYAETKWTNGEGYSLSLQEDGNFVLYNSANQPLWATNTYSFFDRADTLKFLPNGNLVLYHQGRSVWSTNTQAPKKKDNSGYESLCLELRKDGNLVIYNPNNPSAVLFETKTQGGVRGNLTAVDEWEESIPPYKEDDTPPESKVPIVLQPDYSFPSNENLIFVLSNVKSSLPSGQGQIRFYYKNIPGYADGFTVLNLYKTHLIEKNKKIGIGKSPETELDVKGTVSAECFVGQGAVVKGMIVMWYGEVNKAPDGWAICDGKNGTPDLSDRFIMGARTNNFGDKGGSSSVTLTIDNMPRHQHSGRTNESGRHNHRYTKTKLNNKDVDNDDTMWSCDYEPAYTEDAGEHDHTFETDSQGNGESFEILPPYIALLFIIKL